MEFFELQMTEEIYRLIFEVLKELVFLKLLVEKGSKSSKLNWDFVLKPDTACLVKRFLIYALV